MNSLQNEIFSGPSKFENGYITPPSGPGLGVEADETVVGAAGGHGLTGREEPR